MVGRQVGAAHTRAADKSWPSVEVAEGADAADAAVGGRTAADAEVATLARRANEATSAAAQRVVCEVRARATGGEPVAREAAEADVAVCGSAEPGRARAERVYAHALGADLSLAAGGQAVAVWLRTHAAGELAIRDRADPRGAHLTAEPAVVRILGDVDANSVAAESGVEVGKRALVLILGPENHDHALDRWTKGALAAALPGRTVDRQAALDRNDASAIYLEALLHAERARGAAPRAGQATQAAEGTALNGSGVGDAEPSAALSVPAVEHAGLPGARWSTGRRRQRAVAAAIAVHASHKGSRA